MSSSEHVHCDYCGRKMGEKGSYSFRRDKNDKHWCGRCTGPEYTIPDPDLDGVGEHRVGFTEHPGWEGVSDQEKRIMIKKWQDYEHWEGETIE